ncbi:MAG: hypothetical protein ACO1NO_11440 [Burkholderiaceae bacterium]
MRAAGQDWREFADFFYMTTSCFSKEALRFVSRSIAFLSIIAFLNACAMGVTHSPVTFEPVNAVSTQAPKTLSRHVDITLDTGYSRSLRLGSQWVKVGTIPQGEVYKPFRDIFTLEGAHVHEAYLVVSGDNLVGFYLPVERGFSPLKQKVNVSFA